MVLLHAAENDVDWALPVGFGQGWEVILDTAAVADAGGPPRVCQAGEPLRVWSRSLVVLRRP
jgi:hypothetical protein